MNPISHQQLAQNTHKEYEDKYGSRYANNESRQESASPFSRHKLALALSGISIIGSVAMIFQLL
jgi:hypothetical protein